MNTLCKFLLLLLTPSGAWSFPPAPYYTLYGVVRDQVGQTVSAQGAEIILLKGGVEIGRTPISSAPVLEQNYELRVRLDHNRLGTTLYTDKAIATQGLFSLQVEMNGVRYYPIEVSGSLTTGTGSERIRLDLTLGDDSDGDGLPDTWEQWQLYQAGVRPDENGIWPIHLITKDGDYDGDRRSNWDEYIAGTFAGDPTEFFRLESKEFVGEKVRLEFFAVTGKTYRLERGTDLASWTRIPFGVGSVDAEESFTHTADSVGIQSIFVPPVPGPIPGKSREFYRLLVQ